MLWKRLIKSFHQNSSTVDGNHLDVLDGFRASMALWVLFGHLSIATGFVVPILSAPGRAVDGFIMLSGFLMAYTWKKPLFESSWRDAKIFYINRFFRIAPLFYLLLIVSVFPPQLTEMYDAIRQAYPPPWAHKGDVVHTVFEYPSPQWIFLHITFLFGLFPGFENSSLLPEWSLSLEMQFYLIFPLLLLILNRFRMIAIAIVISTLAAISPVLLGNYLEPGLFFHFGQPSPLPFRLNVFLSGMLLAYVLKKGINKEPKVDAVIAVSCAFICLLPLHFLGVVLFFSFVLMIFGNLPLISWLFRTKFMRFLGEISYSIYLSHMLVIIGVVYLMTENAGLRELPPILRFLLSALFVLPLTVIFSFVLYRVVEIPFMRYGRKILKRRFSEQN